MKIGYHYTTYENWQNIKECGLIPYNIYKHELEQYGLYPVSGIWVWKHAPRGIAEAGSIIYQVQKGCHKVVKLKVKYNAGSIVKYNGKPVILKHNGFIGDLMYHDGSQVAYIVRDFIDAKDIKLVKTFNLVNLTK